MITILLCDDAVAFSVLFTHWMRSCDGVEVVAVAGSPEEAERLAAECQPSVIVLDHLLHSTTSDKLVPTLRAAAPEARVLLISGMLPDDVERAAGGTDVDGFISKASSPQEICGAVRGVAARPPRD